MRGLLLLPCFVALSACGGAPPRTCGSNAACTNGDVCIISTCTSSGSPVPTTSRRIVLDAEGLVYVTASSGADVRAPVVALGGSIGGGARILAKFPRGDWKADRIAKAYLLLERADGAPSGPNEVLVRAEKIVESWSPKVDGKGISWASPPRAEAIPGGEAHVAPYGHGLVRIDVTPYAVDLAKPTVRAFGLRIEADGGGYGVPIATGLGGGHPPRLEVYLN